MSNVSETYQIHLPQFDGPFDLLLFFIERDELDIYDIPISGIAQEFLSFIQQMEKLNIELAADFILTASTLMQIKAKMLLPRKERNENGEFIDPRTELVERLLEYKRYKMVLAEIQNLESQRQDLTNRGFAKEEQNLFKSEGIPEQELYGLDLYAILKTFKKVMERHQAELEKPKHVIQPYPYRMEDVKQDIQDRIRTHGKTDFVTLILSKKDKMYAVFCFLSILELVQFRIIQLLIGEGYNNFWLLPAEPENPQGEVEVDPITE
ncbi:MAG: chromosome segregation protein ScpA [Sphingobacteriia bacterium]|nr:chromosome segregation protein ScpA [Sphingobacteriia bacterium]